MMTRPILACVSLLLLLAACAGEERPGEHVLGARGSTMDHVRGAAPSSSDILRPEPGNIWSEGLTLPSLGPDR